MRLLTGLLSASLLVLFTACGGGSPAEQSIGHFETFVEALESVEGPDDVDAAVAKIEKAKAAMKKMEKELEGKPAPDMSEAQEERMSELQDRMRKAMMGFGSNPELAGSLDKLMAVMDEE
ncbi:MAG: hypothetical protein AAFU73_18895 [Planctomycetota bacterium]